jgi:pimeloyl-ACP methyl ester carboxylesterase
MKRPAVRVAVLALLAVAAVSRPSVAQDQTVVFVHGLRGDGASWADTAQRLEADLAISAQHPTLDWRRTFPEQVSQLQQALGLLPASTIAVGHSNGGLVARAWSKSQPLAGLVTVGTPNWGTPVTYNLLDWANFNFLLGDTIADLYGAFSSCVAYGCQWQWVFYQDALNVYLSYLQHLLNGSLTGLVTTVGIDLSVPVVTQMSTQSSFLQDLDSSANLAREASAVPVRVGIVSEAHNFYQAGPFRAVWPDYGDKIAVIKDSAIFLLDYWATYIYTHADISDVSAYQIADRMSTVAGWLSAIDPVWCEMVSYPGGGLCTYNDTLVPDWSQALPDAPLLVIADGPAHIQETRATGSWVYQVLTTFMHVPARATDEDDPGIENMQSDSAVRGCSNYVEWPAVYQPSANDCRDYCGQNGADACEWSQGGSCYVEFGRDCYVQGGFGGWYAAVLAEAPDTRSGGDSSVVEMQSASAVRGCSNYVEWAPVKQPSADACVDYCAGNDAAACEWADSGDCYVEFGNGCYVQTGFAGWSAVVFGSSAQDQSTVMQSASAVRGCADYRESAPVYQQDASSCLSYCQQSAADACEWSDGGSCYVEFGIGCYVQSGFSGWSAAVLR